MAKPNKEGRASKENEKKREGKKKTAASGETHGKGNSKGQTLNTAWMGLQAGSAPGQNAQTKDRAGQETEVKHGSHLADRQTDASTTVPMQETCTTPLSEASDSQDDVDSDLSTETKPSVLSNFVDSQHRFLLSVPHADFEGFLDLSCEHRFDDLKRIVDAYAGWPPMKSLDKDRHVIKLPLKIAITLSLNDHILSKRAQDGI